MRKFGFSLVCQTKEDGRKECTITNHFVQKFQNDKICQEDDSYSIVLDGVILNKKVLSKRYDKESWFGVVSELYRDKGDTFFNEFRGSFAGVLFDKAKQRLIAFSDHIGSKFVYYTKVGDTIMFSTMMDDIYQFRKINQAKNNLSIENSYLLLSYGYMIDDRTLCEEIKKIKPGYYLTVQDELIEESPFFMLDNTADRSLTEEDYIEKVDEEFRKAVKLQFEKDDEYGYKHLVALSAGLDSRMTCWVAHELGYKDQLNFTFSQSGYYDETVPKQIIGDLRHEWIFKPLDNGLWLYNLDEITRLTGGNVLYYGLSHAYSMFSNLNFNDYGMFHTGQLGDVILGTWFDIKDDQARFNWGDGAYSKTMLEKIKDLKHSEYKNQELSKLYLRGFNGTNNGNMAEYAFTESMSPFYNLEFFKTALSIPVEYRYNHRIYKKWIIRKYPKAADYTWEKIGCKITRKIGVITMGGKTVSIEHLPVKVLRKFSNSFALKNKQDMNPLAYYIDSNRELSAFLDSYKKYAEIIPDAQLKEDVLRLTNSQNGVERIQAVSLLSAIKYYFSE
jgi:asparagine synthase (glutamine-hydrolysing)